MDITSCVRKHNTYEEVNVEINFKNKVFEIHCILKFKLYDSEYRPRTDLPFEILIWHLNLKL
jgi:hypothetical protein